MQTKLEALLGEIEERLERATPEPIPDDEDVGCGVCWASVHIHGDVDDFIADPICNSCSSEALVDLRPHLKTLVRVVRKYQELWESEGFKSVPQEIEKLLEK